MRWTIGNECADEHVGIRDGPRYAIRLLASPALCPMGLYLGVNVGLGQSQGLVLDVRESLLEFPFKVWHSQPLQDDGVAVAYDDELRAVLQAQAVSDGLGDDDLPLLPHRGHFDIVCGFSHVSYH